MKKFNFILKKSFWKNVLAVALVAILCAGVIGGGIALGKYIKDKKTTVTSIWERGAIASDGRVDSNNNSIHTKDLFECRGLEIEPKLDANVKYRVAFYDTDKNFVEMTDFRYTKMNSTEVPFFAQYARVEINAGVDDDGEKVEISLLKIAKYSKQVKIRVDKKQSSVAARIKTVTLTDNVVSSFTEGYVNHLTGEEVSNSNTNMFMANPIDVSEANYVIVKVKTSSLSHKVTVFNQVLPGVLYYMIKDNAVIGNINTASYNVCYKEEDCTYICFNVINADSFVLSVDEDSKDVLAAYLFN